MGAAHLAHTLRNTRRNGRGWMCRCPVHEDKDPSLSVEDREGKILVHCFGGCSQEVVISELRRLGLWPKSPRGDPPSRDPKREKSHWTPIMPVPEDAPRPPKAHPRLGKPSYVSTYQNAEGATLGHEFRFHTDDGKAIRPLTFCKSSNGTLAWQWKSFPKPRPLYGLHQLARRPDAPVLVVEGENAADAAHRLLPNWVVATWPGGAKAVHLADWSALAGRRVTVWGDADDAGRKAALEVSRQAHRRRARSIRTVEPPKGVPEGWDIADAEAEGWDTAKVMAFLTDYARTYESSLDEAPPPVAPPLAGRRRTKMARPPFTGPISAMPKDWWPTTAMTFATATLGGPGWSGMGHVGSRTLPERSSAEQRKPSAKCTGVRQHSRTKTPEREWQGGQLHPSRRPESRR